MKKNTALRAIWICDYTQSYSINDDFYNDNIKIKETVKMMNDHVLDENYVSGCIINH